MFSKIFFAFMGILKRLQDIERQDATDAAAAADATVAASTAATATTTHVGVPKDFFFPLHMYIWICI